MQHHAFTTRYNGRARVLHNIVGVSLPVTPGEAQTQQVKPRSYLAIWDTGATHSAITKRVVDDLGLKPTGVRETRHADGKSLNNTYLVNILLPNGVMVGNVRVTEVKLIPDDNTSDDKQPQLLIGMDIIGLGDFAVTNTDGKTTFSFRVPSVEEIDFIPDTQESNVTEGGNRKARRAFFAKKRRGLI
ncbi:MAG: SEC-C motif domain protein [Parcubacteria group bacterium Gr01-1014_48]|nr:MAG: SEC-C motif domain protein [Parcubacteria group bacterium Greene0416_14]TSC73888.1 MAG: SEC-C motif domain protein [Parcubacteria group bacterium Gr01-1014_48]TSD01555.1 MAG: SEC-C motif domain protein [Parcubacteria group bacterium Greene1014_15]TSD08145.1 MAG: SEC-C motif domain protein [Parcubacteria group bacterium Greene0714_4]